jgi:hypothetical protein
VEGSAVPRTSPGNAEFGAQQNCHFACPGAPWDRSVPGFPASLHWIRPRTLLSLKERRMMFDNASNFLQEIRGSAVERPAFSPVLTQTLNALSCIS